MERNPFNYARDPRAASERLFSPLVKRKYEDRTICPNLDLATWHAKRFTRSCARAYAPIKLQVSCCGRVQPCSVYPRKDWQMELRQQIERVFGIICHSVCAIFGHGRRQLEDCKIFELHRARCIEVEPRCPSRPAEPVCAPDCALPWGTFRKRVVQRACSSLPRCLAKMPCHEARKFLRSRAQMTGWARGVLQEPELLYQYDDGSFKKSSKSWFGAELMAAHSVSVSGTANSAAERALFDREHGLLVATEYDAMASNLAVECAKSLSTHFSDAMHDATCPPSEEHMSETMHTHFDGNKDFTLHIGCDCANKKRKQQGQQLESLGDSVATGSIDAALFRRPSFMLSKQEKAERATRAATKSAAKSEQLEAAEKARAEAEQKAKTARENAAAARSARKSSVGIEAIALPPLVPIECEGVERDSAGSVVSKLPPLVPIEFEGAEASALPPLVPIESVGSEANALPPLVPIETQTQPIGLAMPAESGRIKTRSPNGVTTINNFTPLLKRYVEEHAIGDAFVALAPTDDVFTREHAGTMSRLAPASFAREMSRYVAPDPARATAPNSPVTLQMHSGAQMQVTHDRQLLGVPNPQLVARHVLGGELVAYAHKNLFSASPK